MITVSLCMIVRNEEDTIERCLNSAKCVADEIIIADTGSDDRTKEIASRFTDRIYDFEWTDDFSAARNFSYGWAEMDYILWLDADDILLPEDAVKLKKLKETLTPDVNAVMMKYNTGFDINGKVNFSYYRERLSKRSAGFKWSEPVHEFLEVSGKTINADIGITHAKPFQRRGSRNITIYENLIACGRTLSPRGMYYYARELKDHERYAEAIDWFRRFLNSERGWIEDNIAACGELARCYLAENRQREALSAMLRSFCYDSPRAEACCQIGYYFQELEGFEQAAFWFELALKAAKNENRGFQHEDCKGYIPCIELAICYDKLEEYERAAEFNEMASKHKPNSPAVLHNRKYFANLFASHGN